MAARDKRLTWFITECSSGFGLSLMRIVQAQGHRVIAASRNPFQTPNLVREVKSNGGKWLKLDVNDPTSSKLIDELEGSGEQIDVLVNSADGAINAPIETTTEDEIRAQMATMSFGPLCLIRALLPYQRERKFGIIVNLSSATASKARNWTGADAGANQFLVAAADSTRHVTALTKILAKDLAPSNIRVLTVLLGTLNTNMSNPYTFSKTHLSDEYENTVLSQTADYIRTGKIVPTSDKDKAMKALYQIVMGERSGVGKESEDPCISATV